MRARLPAVGWVFVVVVNIGVATLLGGCDDPPATPSPDSGIDVPDASLDGGANEDAPIDVAMDVHDPNDAADGGLVPDGAPPSDAAPMPDGPASDGSMSDARDGGGEIPAVLTPAPNALFATDMIDVALTFPPASWAHLMARKHVCQPKVCHSDIPEEQGFRRGDCPGYNDYVPCTAKVLGVQRAAGCRMKGLPQDWGCGNKEQLVVRFNIAFPDPAAPFAFVSAPGRLFGMRKLNLDANSFDRSQIRHDVAMEVMRGAGIPTPRTNLARVTVDTGAGPHYFGVYINTEVIDEEFVQSRFPVSTGNLFDGKGNLETNEKANDRSDYVNFYSYVDDARDEMTYDEAAVMLPKLLDIPAALRLWAAEAALPTSDNWWSGGYNYFLYNDPRRGFVPLPWDLDDALGKGRATAAVDLVWIPNTATSLEVNDLGLMTWDLVRRNPAWLDEYKRLLRAIGADVYAPLAADGGYVDKRCALVKAGQTPPAGVPVASPANGFEADNYVVDLDDLEKGCTALKAHMRTRAQRVATEL